MDAHQQPELTDEQAAQLMRRIEPYASRNAFVPETQHNNGFWDHLRAQTDRARELFEALSVEQQADIVRTEDALEAHRVRKEERFQVQQELKRRVTRLHEAHCRLRDDDLRLVVHSRLADTQALKAVRDWYAEPLEACLVLAGGCGVGKTLAAADRIASHQFDSLFLDADDACKVFTATFGDDRKLALEARNTSLLVLDDVGAETDPQRMAAVLVSILNSRRSARQHRWILSTNLNKRDFATRYPNERLLSRMQQVVWVSVSDADLRKGAK